MASRYDILLEKPIPEVIYTEPRDFWKIGKKVFSNYEKALNSTASGVRDVDEEHKCGFRKIYATQDSEGFICSCDKLWKYMNYSTLKEWEEKIEVLNKKKEQRIKKGFTPK